MPRAVSSIHTKMLYPFFFAANAVLTKDVALASVPLLLTPLLIVSALIFWSMLRITKDIHRSGFATVLVLAWTMYYGAAYSLLVPRLNLGASVIGSHILFLSLWTGGFVLAGSGWLWRKIGSGQRATAYLNLATLSIFVLFGYNVARVRLHRFVDPVEPSAMRLPQPDSGTSQPDIYYIIFDAYDRSDVLERVHGYDNSELMAFLSSRGFYVADQSHSNYAATEYSLASSLNMSYLHSLPDVTIGHSSVFHKLITDGQVRSSLESLGYRFVAFSTPYYPTNASNADVFLSASDDNSYAAFLMSQFVPSSIAALPISIGLFSATGETYRDHQARVAYMLDQLGRVPHMPGPKFVFAHFMVPHGPYIFDRNGPVTPDKPLLPGWLSTEEHLDGYIQVVEYLDPLIAQMIDAILRNSTSPPIIVIQSDHGSRLSLGGAAHDVPCLQDWFSILNAYYLPGVSENMLYPTLTPVNTFRLILDQYFDMHLDLLEDRQYTAVGYEFTDVTETKYNCQQ